MWLSAFFYISAKKGHTHPATPLFCAEFCICGFAVVFLCRTIETSLEILRFRADWHEVVSFGQKFRHPPFGECLFYATLNSNFTVSFPTTISLIVFIRYFLTAGSSDSSKSLANFLQSCVYCL